MNPDLSEYKVSFYRLESGRWYWKGIEPSGREFGPEAGYFVTGHKSRSEAEREALNWLPNRGKPDKPEETISGTQLQERLGIKA